MALSLAQVAELVDGDLVGDPERRIEAVRALEAAGPEDLAFVTSGRYREKAEGSGAGAFLVPEELRDLSADLVVCRDPGMGIVAVLEALYPVSRPVPGVHPSALVGAESEIHGSAAVGPFTVIGRDCRIEAEVVVHPGVVIGDGCRIGRRSMLYPRAVLYPGTVLGEEVIVHAGAVLGSDGFGYATGPRGPVKVPQVGRLVVEDGVEIGANTTIDRATLEETRIGAGSKLDNLVQVGHNVELGPACVLCGQSGVAGSARLGRGVVLGGQAGVGDHLEIGDGVQVAAKSAALQSVEAARVVAGIPAVDVTQWRRRIAMVGRLGEILRRLRALEKRIEGGEEENGDES